MNHLHLTLEPGALALSDLRAAWSAHGTLALADSARAPIEASAAAVQAIVAKGDPAYGINTGFGLLAKRHIPPEQLEQLQQNLILSHAVGTGELLSDAVSDWPLLNAMLNTAGGATWVSLHHGGGVGMGYSQHAGVVIVADGSAAADKRLARVLVNDCASGVMRHADAGYELAIATAKRFGLTLPMIK